MAETDNAWIDAGYLRTNCPVKKREIDISCYIPSSQNKNTSLNTCTACGSFEISKFSFFLPEKLYFWYSSSARIEITEQCFFNGDISQTTLILIGPSSFHKDLYLGVVGGFFYIIFGVNTYLVILSFKLDSENNLDSLLDIEEKSLLKHINFFDIYSQSFYGGFNSSLNSFLFCDSNNNFQKLNFLGLPPTEAPTSFSQISTHFDSMGIFGDIINAVPVLKFLHTNVVNITFLSLDVEALTFFWVMENGFCCLVFNDKFHRLDTSPFFPTAIIKNRSLLLPESTVRFLNTTDKNYIALLGVCQDTKNILLFSYLASASLVELKLIKSIKPPDFTLSISLHFNFIAVTTNVSGIQMYNTTFSDTDNSWKCLNIFSKYNFTFGLEKPLNAAQLNCNAFYFYHINSTHISDTAFDRCIQSNNYLDVSHQSQISNRFIVENIFNSQTTLKRSEILFELKNICQSLEEIQTLLEKSTENVTVHVHSSYLFLFVPNIGIKLIFLVSDSINESLSFLRTSCFIDLKNITIMPSVNSLINFNQLEQYILKDLMPSYTLSSSLTYGYLLARYPKSHSDNSFPLLFDLDYFESILESFAPSSKYFFEPKFFKLSFQEEIEICFPQFSVVLANTIRSVSNFRAFVLLSLLHHLRCFSIAMLLDRLTGIKFGDHAKLEKLIPKFCAFLIGYSFIDRLGLMSVDLKSNDKISVLDFVLGYIDFSEFDNSSMLIVVDHILSRLLFDVSIYLPLIKLSFFDQCSSIFSNLEYFYSKFKRVKGTEICHVLKTNLHMAYILLRAGSTKSSKVLVDISKFFKTLSDSNSVKMSFDQSDSIILNIVNACSQYLNPHSFYQVIRYIFDSVKNIKVSENLVESVKFSTFNYNLKRGHWLHALHVIFSFEYTSPYLVNCIELLISKLVENKNKNEIVNLNYFYLNPLVYTYLLSLANKSINYSDQMWFFQLLVEFNLIRNMYREASSINFQAFIKFLNLLETQYSYTVLMDCYKFLESSYYCLKLIDNLTWRFIYYEHNMQDSFLSFLKKEYLIKFNDLKEIYLVFSCLVLIFETYPDFSLKNFVSYEALVEILCEKCCYEKLASFCVDMRLLCYAHNIIKAAIDSCICHQNVDFSQFQASDLFKHNSFSKLLPNSSYDVWDWFQKFLFLFESLGKNLFMYASEYLLENNLPIPIKIKTYLGIHKNNEFTLLLLSHDKLLEASHIFINHINDINHSRKHGFISCSPLEQILCKLEERMSQVSSKFEPSNDKINEYKSLKSLYDSLLSSVKVYISDLKNGFSKVILQLKLSSLNITL